MVFEKVESQQTGGAHQFAPVAAQPGSVSVLPKQKGGFAQDAEVAFPAGHFGGVVEGVGLAAGKRRDSPGPLKGAEDVDDLTR